MSSMARGPTAATRSGSAGVPYRLAGTHNGGHPRRDARRPMCRQVLPDDHQPGRFSWAACFLRSSSYRAAASLADFWPVPTRMMIDSRFGPLSGEMNSSAGPNWFLLSSRRRPSGPAAGCRWGRRWPCRTGRSARRRRVGLAAVGRLGERDERLDRLELLVLGRDRDVERAGDPGGQGRRGTQGGRDREEPEVGDLVRVVLLDRRDDARKDRVVHRVAEREL